MALVLVLIFVVILAYSIFLGRFYTGFALPALKEDQSFLPSRQIDQLKRYIENEESAGRRRWYFGLARRSVLIQSALFVLWTAAAIYLSVQTAPAAEPQPKLVAVVVLSDTSCAVGKTEVPCSDVIGYLKDTLHVSAETWISVSVSGGSSNVNAMRARELVKQLRDSGLPNSGPAGFIKD